MIGKLFQVYGWVLRARAWVREWYAFYFHTEEYFNRLYADNEELRRQLDEGDWNAYRS